MVFFHPVVSGVFERRVVWCFVLFFLVDAFVVQMISNDVIMFVCEECNQG